MCVSFVFDGRQIGKVVLPPTKVGGRESEVLALRNLCLYASSGGFISLAAKPSPCGCSASDKDFPALLSTALETNRDRQTHQKTLKKIPPPGSVSAQLSPSLGTFGEGSPGHTENTDPRPADLRHEMERLQTESAHAHCGTERKVIGPLTPILSDHCPSLGLS